jgi:segregation and condensation protein B
MATDHLPSILESMLFVADGPVTLDRLAGWLEEFDRAEIKEALLALRDAYAPGQRGIFLEEVAGGWQFRTEPLHADYVRRMTRQRVTKFSQSSLESLAIIAYRQPVTRAEIEYLRGVDCGAVLKNLLDKKLIKILGKKDIPGKPLIYGTTKEFLTAFSLKDLACLPTLREVQDLIPTSYEQGELPLAVSAEEAMLLQDTDEID